MRYSKELLTRTAAEARSLADLAQLLGTPADSGTVGYLRRRLRHYGVDVRHFEADPPPARQRRRWTADALSEAAARARDQQELFALLGIAPRDRARDYLPGRIRRLGIDTSHFPTRGRITPGSGELCEAVAKVRSVAGLLRALGLTDTTSARRHIRNAVDAQGLSLAHFTGQGHARGRASPRRKSADVILALRPPGSSRERTPLLRRALDERGVPRSCVACGTGEVWQGRRLVLEIDHVNGDPLDNRQANLRYLCPSCHSQTPRHSRRRTGGNPSPSR